MSQSPTRVQRLVRLNQFREDLASDAFREAVVQQQQAQEHHQSATTEVERLGDWKLRGNDEGGLDLAFYGVALDLEFMAMSRVDELKQALSDSEQRTELAQEALIAAACAMRVAENRRKRERSLDEVAREKRSFDQLSDVWLNNRERARD